MLALTPTPPANAFVPKEKCAEEQHVFPLDVFFCNDCGHVQLLDIVDPNELFSNYVYVSGTSPVFIDHFRHYAENVLKEYVCPANGYALDIGSNDGTLLSFFKNAGMGVLGVDPARAIAEDATARGLETLVGFFNRETAANIHAEKGPAAVITANNVFAHVDDLGGVTDSVRSLLAPDGVFVFEVSYLLDVLEKTLFDTIYHEHLSYHSVGSLVPFFKARGLELIDAQKVDTHGGSLRGICQPAGGSHKIRPSVSEMVANEKDRGLDKTTTFKRFASDIGCVKQQLQDILLRLRSDGKTVAGYGAPAKATTLMYHFGIGPLEIDFIVDDSRLKQGLYSPGMHIPIVPRSEIETRKPDYLLILAWNFAETIIKNNKKFIEMGGRFIVPLPDVQII